MLKDIVSVIEMDMDNDSFIRKHECENFNTGSQLLVHQSQEAIFFMNREALDSFGPGRHTLTTQNMPMISKLFNLVSGGTSPFRGELYFVNKTTKLDVKWGTNPPMEYTNPGEYQFPVKVGASGVMQLVVADGRKLLIQLVGTGEGIGAQEFAAKMREVLNSKLKSFMTNFIVSRQISIFDIEAHLDEMSEAMRDKMSGAFDEYGVLLKGFFISHIAKPDNDPSYNEFRKMHMQIVTARGRQKEGLIEQETRSKQIVMEAQALAAKRALEGYTYQSEQSFDVAKRFAENEATGQLANMGVGLGMISGIGGAVGGNIGGMVGGALNQTAASAAGAAAAKTCGKCGASIPVSVKFCPECGAPCAGNAPAAVTCPKCGRSVPKSKFCPECGASLADPVCPKCSAKIAAGAKFCPECGEKLI